MAWSQLTHGHMRPLKRVVSCLVLGDHPRAVCTVPSSRPQTHCVVHASVAAGAVIMMGSHRRLALAGHSSTRGLCEIWLLSHAAFGPQKTAHLLSVLPDLRTLFASVHPDPAGDSGPCLPGFWKKRQKIRVILPSNRLPTARFPGSQTGASSRGRLQPPRWPHPAHSLPLGSGLGEGGGG